MSIKSKGLKFFINRVISVTAFLAILSPFALRANPQCHQAMSKLVDDVAFEEFEPLQLEFDQLLKEVDQSIKKQAENCVPANSPGCLEKAVLSGLEAKHQQGIFKFIDDAKHKSCILSKQKAAREKFIANSNMILNLGAGLGSMYAFHAWATKQAIADGEAPPEFNYALLANAVVFTVYRSIIQCRNELAGASGTVKNGFNEKFKRYLKMALIGNTAYVGLLSIQDMSHGRNPFEKEQWQRYAHEFAFAMVWDTGFSVLNIKMLDKVFLHKLPGLRETIARKINMGIIRPVLANVNGRMVIMLKAQHVAHLPGFAIEALARSAWTAARTAGYLGLRQEYLEWLVDLDDVKDESEDANDPTEETLREENQISAHSQRLVPPHHLSLKIEDVSPELIQTLGEEDIPSPPDETE